MRPHVNALLHGPGLLTVSQVWRCPETAWPEDTRALCARLMKSLATAADDEAAAVLVSISLGCLDDHPAYAELAQSARPLVDALRAGNWRGPHGDILVQIAAPTLAARRNLVYLARRMLEPFCFLEAEDVGARLVAEEGDFPLPFSPAELHQATSIPDGPAAGASWVVYQRWLREVALFELTAGYQGLDELRAEDVLDDAASRLPDGSLDHVRRAFSFRDRNHDGLCALTSCADARRMADLIACCPHDAEDEPTAAKLVDLSFFVAPPSAQWLHWEPLTPPKSTGMPA